MKKSIFKTVLSLACGIFIYTNSTYATNYHVGTGQTYTTITTALINLLAPGDTVFINGNHTYSGGLVFTKNGTATNKIVLKGVKINNLKPVFSGSAITLDFTGSHYIIDGIDVKSATAKGIRNRADDLTIRNCVIHDCKNGILGSDFGTGSLTIEYTEMYNCGSGGYDHTIYVATDQATHPGAVLRIQYCYFHNNIGGNMIKSRAERNEIYYNWVDASINRELEMNGPDVPAGAQKLYRMDGDVVGNVFIHRDPLHPSIRPGGDGTLPGSGGRYRFMNNTFIFELNSDTSVFEIRTSLESMEMHNNVIYRKDGGMSKIIFDNQATWTQGHPIYAGSNNWITTGTTDIPAEWTGTIFGVSNPGFVNMTTNDVNLTSGSVLVNGGNASPISPAGFEIPNPLYPPAFQPPLHVFSLTSMPRPVSGTLDIGAFEFAGAPTGVTISTQPSNKSACAGANVNIGLTATNATSYQWQVNTGGGFVNLSNGGFYSNATTATLTITGATVSMNNYQYQCIVSGSGSNVTSNTAILTVNPLPDVTTTVSVNTITANQAGATYQWINCTGNTPIANATNQSYNATISGNYAVVVTQNSCSDTSACVNIIVTGIQQEVSDNPQLSIYPNPANGKFTIKMLGASSLTARKQKGDSKVEVYNLLGEKIYSFAISDLLSLKTGIAIDISSQPAGTYFLQLHTENGILKKKITLNK